jgi:hypothetical protein
MNNYVLAPLNASAIYAELDELRKTNDLTWNLLGVSEIRRDV